MAAVWHFYLRLLRDFTLPTQMVTGGVIGFTADSIAQNIVERKPAQDWARTSRQAFYSFAIFAPAANRMFAALQRINLSTVWRTAFARTGVDMVTFMPFSSLLFFTSMGIMEGRTAADIKHRWQTNFRSILQKQYMVFAPAQVINMALLPLYARPPFMNLLGLGWTSYLALVNSRGKTVPAASKQDAQLAAARIEL